MSLTKQVKVATFSFLNEKSYNKTVIDFNFSRHKDLSTLKSDIHPGQAAPVNYHFFQVVKSLCRHKDLSTLKSDIHPGRYHLGLPASVNYHF